MLTVDTVTIFSLGLNFDRCTVTCPLLQSMVVHKCVSGLRKKQMDTSVPMLATQDIKTK